MASYMSEADYFHVPYPSSPLDLLPHRSSTDTVGDTVDPFDQLPQEVSDQIFSLLSVPTLDAARYVSQTWYRRIMTNSWVLRQVLEPGSYSHLGEDFQSHKDCSKHAEVLRRLSRKLDIQSRLTCSWRIRYRRCDIGFSIPAHLASTEENEERAVSGAQIGSRRITFAGISASGSFVAFIYAGISSREDGHGGGHSVFIYHIDSAGKPELVAPIACPQDNGIPIDVDLSEGVYAGSWLAGVTFSGQRKQMFSSQLGQSRIGRTIALNEQPTSENLPAVSASASIRDVQRYCSTCYDYHKVPVSKDLDVGTILALGSVEDVHTQDDWVCVEKCDCSGAWLILDNLPILVKGTERPYHLARHEQTGNLFVVQVEKCVVNGDGSESETSDSFQNLEEVVPLVLLVRPHRHASYANVSVSPQVMFETSYLQQVLRIAVLWHEADYPATERVGLYMYDVVSLRSIVCDKIGNRIGTADNYPVSGGWRMGTNGQWTPRVVPLPQREPFDYTPAEYLPIDSETQQTMKLKGRVSGRRVCGFERGMGGLHSSLFPPHKPSEKDVANPPLGSIKLLGDGRKKCMIWGPDASPVTDGMSFVILEFGKSWRENEFWELSITENEISNGDSNKSGCCGRHFARHCACAYHDYGYRVTLPDPKAFEPPLVIENAAAKKSLFWPFPSMTTHSAASRSSALGQVVPYRRYEDVLIARKMEVENWRRERLERKEKVSAEVMSVMARTKYQGNQDAQSKFVLRTFCGLRWKGLLGSK